MPASSYAGARPLSRRGTCGRRDPLRRAIARQPTMAEAHHLIDWSPGQPDMEAHAALSKPRLAHALRPREELADYAVANARRRTVSWALTALDDRTSGGSPSRC